MGRRKIMNKYICANRNELYKEEIETILDNRKKEILEFFEVYDDGQFNFNVYVYDNIHDLIKGMSDRGFGKMPDYMCACQKDEDNSLNFFEPKDNPSSDEWSKEEYRDVIFHEEIHGIQSILYGKQPEWLTEGVAKYLDGTYSRGIKLLLENYIHKNIIPGMDELENEFGEHEYDSYDYAYLMVSYLIETLGKSEFLKVIGDQDELKKKSDNLILKAITYYNEKFFGNKFYNEDLSNPNWLFHGSPQVLMEVEKRLSHDSDNNGVNIDDAVFLTPSILISSAYAFRDKIKENSEGLHWDFKIKSHEEFPIMTMSNVNVSDDMVGYIYVFSNDGSFFNEPEGSLQYKSFKNLVPFCQMEVRYEDFKSYYTVLGDDKRRTK